LTVERLWAPSIQRLVARNWNLASPGCSLIRSSVAYIFSVSTPLRVMSVTCGTSASLGVGNDMEDRKSGRPACHRRHHPTSGATCGGLYVRLEAYAFRPPARNAPLPPPGPPCPKR